LSNFSPYQILYNQQVWPTSEHLFQGLKTLIPSFREIIRTAASPALAKRYGNYRTVDIQEVIDGMPVSRKVPMQREDWKDIRVKVMTYVIDLKVDQHPCIAEYLVGTKNRIIIEGNTWCDNFWGNCFCDKCSSVAGENNLGKIFMQKRKKLIQG